MHRQTFPELIAGELTETRDALHAYSGILGGWTATCRERRKHWWHASLRPSLNGVTTGVIYADGIQFQIDLDFSGSRLRVQTASGDPLTIPLRGQAADGPAERICEFLVNAGISKELAEVATAAKAIHRDKKFNGFSTEQADKLGEAISAVSASMVSFRADLREESSPIQLWPHHFDLAMLWLPGEKIPGKDPKDEENSDKQMNFGFTFGDGGIPQPYFYITAYPSPDEFPKLALPGGAKWHDEGFKGVALTYERLLQEADPSACLQELWQLLLKSGRESL